MAGECKPYYQPGTTITGRLDTLAALGKTFAMVDAAGSPVFAPDALSTTTEGGNVPVKQCTAAAKAFGVFQRDKANGQLVGIFRSGVVPVLSGAAVTAGAEVEVDAASKCIDLAAGIPVGRSLNARPAAADTGLPPKVLNSPVVFRKESRISRRVTTTPSGCPLPAGFPIVTTSGTKPCCS